ncbi:MAG TPA: hypothetical protein V6D03_14230 [Candidatus Caenarcaniphilales bacterium]
MNEPPAVIASLPDPRVPAIRLQRFAVFELAEAWQEMVVQEHPLWV